MNHTTATKTVSSKEAGFRADRALCALLENLNRRAAKTLFHKSLVRLNGKVASGAERVAAGDKFEFPNPDNDAADNPIEQAKAPRLTTPHGRHLTRLYEDADVLVISKPAEIPVHRGQGGFTRRDTLEDVMNRAYPPRRISAPARSGPIRHAPRDDEEDDDSVPSGDEGMLATEPGFYFVHRLDMETSGCLLIAKHAAARDALIRDFSARKIHKEYLAVVAGAVSWDEIVSTQPIKYVRGPKSSARQSADGAKLGRPFYAQMRSHGRGVAPKLGQKKGVALEEGSEEGKACETHFEALERYRGYSLLRCEPKTGRTHQIRVHLTALGHPLAYDPFYGRTSAYRMREFDRSLGESERGEELVLNRLPLHAWKLGFTHPMTGKKISIEAPMPRDLKEFVRLLRKFNDNTKRR